MHDDIWYIDVVVETSHWRHILRKILTTLLLSNQKTSHMEIVINCINRFLL